MAIFISHATPEDNDFTRWLGAKLTAMGFEVWADILRLKGGDEWDRKLEQALRQRAVKMLLVCTESGIQKSGVLNEIEIAHNISTQLGDPSFIIPLRLQPFDTPFRIARRQYIDFSHSWADGLAELTELLIGSMDLPRNGDTNTNQWLMGLQDGAGEIIEGGERLVSNWLQFESLPRSISYFEPKASGTLEQFQDKSVNQWPMIPFRNGILSVASPVRSGSEPRPVPARKVGELEVQEFLREGWERYRISSWDARGHLADLLNQSIGFLLRDRGMSTYSASGDRTLWFGSLETVPGTKLSFSWPGLNGLRQIRGVSDKHGVQWHYAISPQTRFDPVPHVRVSSGLVFTENGRDSFVKAKRMHTLRRSFTKTWRNDRWRDMLLALLHWLSTGGSSLELPLAGDQRTALAIPPMTFDSPVSIRRVCDEPEDEEDPDIELDWYDEVDEEVE